MRRRLDTPPVIALLVCAILVLGAFDWYLLQSTVDTSPLASPRAGGDAPPPPDLVLATPLDKKPAARFQETVSRPLFNPARRPVKREAVVAGGAVMQPNDLRLVGVMRSGDDPPRALIRFANAQTGKWISEGEQVNGWTLRKIGARSVIVEAGGRSHELTFAAPRGTGDDGADTEPGTRHR